MPIPENMLAILGKALDEDKAIVASMSPEKREIFQRFVNEVDTRKSAIPGFFEMSVDDQQIWEEDIEKELFQSMPGSEDALNEFIEQGKLLKSEHKGKVL